MLERRSQTRVLFAFGSHGVEGISFLNAFKGHLRSHFSKGPSDTNYYWAEAADGTPEKLLRTRQFLVEGERHQDIPFLSGLLEMPEYSSLERGHLRVLAQGAKEFYLDRPPSKEDTPDLQHLYFGLHQNLMLDDLTSEGYRIDFNQETHTEEEVIKLETQFDTERPQQIQAAYDFLSSGQIDESVRLYEKALKSYAEYIRERNAPLVRGISEQINRALEERRRVRIASWMGMDHQGTMISIMNIFSPIPREKLKIQSLYENGQNFRTPDHSLRLLLEVNSSYRPTRAEILRAFLADVAKFVLAWRFKSTIIDPLTPQRVNSALERSSDAEIEDLFSACGSQDSNVIPTFLYSKLGLN